MKTKNVYKHLTVPKPKIGQKIYVDTRMSISEGSTDVAGGIATVKRVSTLKYYTPGVYFVEIKECPGCSYNWTQIIGPDQAKLKKEFGKQKAHSDPDINTPWIERGDVVRFGGDEIVHKGSAIW